MHTLLVTNYSVSVTCDRSMVSLDPPVYFTYKTDHHNITEILLKVSLNTIKHTKPFYTRDVNVGDLQIVSI